MCCGVCCGVLLVATGWFVVILWFVVVDFLLCLGPDCLNAGISCVLVV